MNCQLKRKQKNNRSLTIKRKVSKKKLFKPRHFSFSSSFFVVFCFSNKTNMFQLSIKEDKEDDDDTINKTVGINSSKSFVSNTCSTQKLTTVSTIPFNLLNYATYSRNHSEFILNGLKSLKSSRILCDITLIAESKMVFFYILKTLFNFFFV